MRSDPADTGGLFVGRRPGTTRIRFSTAPPTVSERRRHLDGSLANILFAAITVISLLCWGPVPLLSLWIGSQADYLSGSSNVGIVVSFAAAFSLLFGTVSVLTRMDHAWILVRRAAGHDQRTGALARIFAVAAVIGALAFTFWFLVINGPNDPNL
jgi:hypothetical protein